MTVADLTGPPNSSCPRCGAAFRCGMTGGDKECWCVKLPHIMPMPTSPPSAGSATDASCYCPACLQQITDDRQPQPSPAPD